MQGPNGIAVDASSVTLDNIWNYSAGDSWIVVEGTKQGGGRNITIRNSGVRKGAGPVIEAGSSVNFQVENSIFDNIETIYWFYENHRGVFRNNWIRDVHVIINGKGEHGQVELFDNRYFPALDQPFEVSDGAKVQVRNNIWYKD
jgi:hypothetical protein